MMRDSAEVRRLKHIIKKYRSLVFELLLNAENYTDGMDCVFCSGNDGYQSANEREDETIKHTRLCPTRMARGLRSSRYEPKLRHMQGLCRAGNRALRAGLAAAVPALGRL